jgi:hypothetical protein
MIAFELSTGEIVSVRTSQSIEFELNNAALENDLIPGSHSMEVTIDDVDGNMRKLQNAYKYDILERNTVFDGVKVVLFGNRQYLGKLIVRRVRDNGLDAFMVINGFSIDILEKTLPEIDYGANVNLGADAASISTAAAAYVSQNYPDVNFNFPMVYAPNLYDGEALGWSSIDTVDPWESDKDYDLRDLITWTDGYVYVCTTAASAGESPTTHPAKWTVLTGNSIINNWDDAAGEFRYNNSTFAYSQNGHAICPQMYDKFVLKSIQSTIGYRVIGEFMADVQTDQSMLINTEVMDSQPQQVIVKAEQDTVYDANTNPYASGGSYFTGTSGANGYFIHFNNEITDPNDDWTVENPWPSYPAPPSFYTIHSEGLHRITISLELISGAADPPYDLKFQVNGIDVEIYQFSAASGTITHSFEWFAPAGNIGDTIAVQIINSLGIGTFEFDAGSYIQIENLSANQYNAWDGLVEHANHVPDVTVRKYLLSLKKRFNLSVKLNFFQKTIELNYCKNILARQPKDFTDIIQIPESDVQEAQGVTMVETPESNVPHTSGDDFSVAETYINYQAMLDDTDNRELQDVVLITSQFAFYRLEQNAEGLLQWNFEASKLPPLVYGNGARRITMEDCPAQMKYIFTDGDMALIPWVNNTGNTVLFGGISNNKPIIHAMWYGMQDSEGGIYQYPMASGAKYDATGADIGDIDLRFLESLPESVWNKYWEEWVRKVDFNLQMETSANLNYKQIFELDFDSPIRRRFTTYVLKRVIWEVDQNGNIDAEIQAVKITT